MVWGVGCCQLHVVDLSVVQATSCGTQWRATQWEIKATPAATSPTEELFVLVRGVGRHGGCRAPVPVPNLDEVHAKCVL